MKDGEVEAAAVEFGPTEEELRAEEAAMAVERSICETVRGGHQWVRCADYAGREFDACLHCDAERGRPRVGLA